MNDFFCKKRRKRRKHKYLEKKSTQSLVLFSRINVYEFNINIYCSHFVKVVSLDKAIY